jgi:hypothetical protein
MLAVLMLSGCAENTATEPFSPPSRWTIRSDSANVAILQFNRQTYALERGILRRYALCQSCDLDSLPFEWTREQAADFGWELFRYLGAQDTVLYATTIFMGTGRIIVPSTLLPPDSFSVGTGIVGSPVSIRYYSRVGADTAWAAARTLDITREFSKGAYRVGIFRYAPVAGEYYAEKFIVFLYAGSQHLPWPRPN